MKRRPHLGRDDYRLVRTDLRDAEALARELPGGYDVIVHLAARAEWQGRTHGTV